MSAPTRGAWSGDPSESRPSAARPRTHEPPGPLSCEARSLKSMNENFSLIVMCVFLLGSLAFLAQQLTSYH